MIQIHPLLAQERAKGERRETHTPLPDIQTPHKDLAEKGNRSSSSSREEIAVTREQAPLHARYVGTERARSAVTESSKVDWFRVVEIEVCEDFDGGWMGWKG